MGKGNGERVAWIDACRGLAAVLVVFGHSEVYDGIVRQVLCSIHVPLFFFLSGWLAGKRRRPENTGKAIASRAVRLLWPYAAFSALIAVWLVISGNRAALPSFAVSVFSLSGYNTLWYLPTCALAETAFSLAEALTGGRDGRRPAWLTAFFFLTTLWLARGAAAAQSEALWSSSTVPPSVMAARVSAAAFFVALGSWSAGLKSPAAGRPKWIRLGAAAALAAVWIAGALRGGMGDLRIAFFGNPAVYLVSRGAGVLCAALLFSGFSAQSRLLCRAGKDSLVIMCTHYALPVLKLARKIAGLLPAGVPALLQAVLVTAAVLLLEAPIAFAIRRWFPFMTAPPRRGRAARRLGSGNPG